MDRLMELRAFIAVAKLKSFRKAAESLDMSCSTISRAVSDLETRTSMRLFNRTTRNVSLTVAALEYYDRCVSILAQLDEAESHMLCETKQAIGTLNLSVHPMVAAGELVRLLDGYRKLAPLVSVNIKMSDKRADFAVDTYDVAIAPRETIATASVISRPLLKCSRILVATPAYLRMHAEICYPGELAKHTMLCTPDFSIDADRKLDMFNGARRVQVAHVTTICANELAARQFALAGLGVALLPTQIVEDDCVEGRLEPVLRDWQIDKSETNLCLTYPSRHFMPLRTRVFIDHAVQLMRASTELPSSPDHIEFRLRSPAVAPGDVAKLRSTEAFQIY